MATRLVILKSEGTPVDEGMGTRGHCLHIGELILTQISKTQTLVSSCLFPKEKKQTVCDVVGIGICPKIFWSVQ